MASGGAATAALVAKKALNASNLEISLLYSAGGIGLLTTLALAGWMHRHKMMPFVVWPEAIARAAFILVAFAAGSWTFTLCASLAYAAGSTIRPAEARLYKSNYPDEIRGRVFGLVRRGMVVAHLASAQVIGISLDRHPELYGLIYPLLGFIGLLGTLSVSRIKVQGEGQFAKNASGQALGDVWRIIITDRPYVAFILIWGLFGFSYSIVGPVKAIYLADPEQGFNASYAASLLILVVLPGALTFITLPLWGRALDRIPVASLRIPQLILVTVSAFLWAVGGSLWVLAVAGLLSGIASGGGQIMGNIGLFEFAERKNVSLYVSIHTTLLGMRMLIGPQIGRLIVEHSGVRSAFWVSACIAGLSIILMSALAKGMHNRRIGRYGQLDEPSAVVVSEQ